ncbi:MAG TPA: DUF58 domain-containing protein [Casimicrobiaceae bacterium]|nr:DUF58 domain-containing protein [Casimicrobiaceae bacterium]
MLRGPFRRWRERVLRRAPSDAGEILLGHARIYILPTRRGLAVAGTVATMLLTALNYGLALGFLVAFLLSGLCAAALLHTFRNLSGLAIRPGTAGEAFVGGTVAFTLHVAAGTRDRVGIAVAARGAPASVVDVDADGQVAVVVEVPASRRGRVPLGRVTLSSDFPLGLWRGWAYVHFPLDGLAYPTPEPGAPPLPAPQGGADDQGSSRREDGDLAGLRTYQHGDPLQRIAWKTVARGGGWYTKAFDGAGGGGPVVLDFAALPAALDTERKLERLCAWVLACERAARPCALVLPGRRVPVGQGREHRRDALAALALHGSG